MGTATGSLYELAHLYGVQTAYHNVLHQRRPASVDTLLTILKALEAPLERLEDVPSALRERRKELWQRPLEPVTVAWNGNLSSLSLRLPSSLAEVKLACHLTTENGECCEQSYLTRDLKTLEMVELEGMKYELKELHWKDTVPPGYHRLSVRIKGVTDETLVISAPTRLYHPPEAEAYRRWGVFIPLYALTRGRGWGSGDLSDLQTLVSWVSEMGGNIVGMLPMLAAFLDNTTDPSPYIPASRLLWNEFYLDIMSVPELEICQKSRALLTSVSFQKEIETLRNAPQVDYHRIMIKKRQILEELCRCLFATPSKRRYALLRFIKTNPVVEDYACFRAARERHGPSWQTWPRPLFSGVVGEGDYGDEAKQYYLYTQWLIHEQMTGLLKTARASNVTLYFDLPLGIHPDSYDIWRERDAFISGISAGAPPDAIFTKGQNWGFPPLHPERIRKQGYHYFIAYLRHHLKSAGVLRIDHVMGLHRLFCIPESMSASEGTYVRYHPDELYAILSLESHRSRTVIVGEDLGTVPHYVRPVMKKHGVYRMYVMHYELASAGTGKILKPIPGNSIASLNTHDMFPFAAIWNGLDIEQRAALGLLGSAAANRERRFWEERKRALVRLLQEKGVLDKTPASAEAVLRACLAFLSVSDAGMVLVNLEDLWLETRPQNIPSTTDDVYPNWRNKARYRLDELCQMPQVVAILRMVDRIRKRGKSPR
jgi:4-alpha-glucanotransferase